MAQKLNNDTSRYYKKYDLPSLSPEIAASQIDIASVQKFLFQSKISKRLTQIESEIDDEGITLKKKHPKDGITKNPLWCGLDIRAI